MSASRRLRVIAGRQRDACAPLAPGGVLTLGRDLDCDIVMREPDMPAVLLRLAADAYGEIHVEPLEAGVRLDGVALPAGERTPVASGMQVEAGSLVFVIEPSEARASPSGASAASARSIAPTDGDAVAIGSGESTSTTSPFLRAVERAASVEAASGGTGGTAAAAGAAPSASRTPLRFGTVASIVCLALAAWFWFSAGRGVAEDDSPLEVRVAETFPGLTVERVASGRLVVGGFLPEQADAIRLERWLEAQPETPRNEVLVDARLAERVEDVFRVNGIEAGVRSLDGGEAIVDTAVADTAELARVEALVNEDVPQLVSLTLANVPPVSAPKDTPYDPGKRVALVVATAPAYIVTTDRSRYFVGAMLPSGHRIRAIEENVVHLEKGGIETELQF